MIKALKICGYVSAVICVLFTLYNMLSSNNIGFYIQLSGSAMYRLGYMFGEFLAGMAGAALSLIGFWALAEHLENKEEINRLLDEISWKMNNSDI